MKALWLLMVLCAGAFAQGFYGVGLGYMQPTGDRWAYWRGAPAPELYVGLGGRAVDLVLGARAGLWAVARRSEEKVEQGEWHMDGLGAAWLRPHLPLLSDWGLDPELGWAMEAYGQDRVISHGFGPWLGLSWNWNWLGVQSANAWPGRGYGAQVSGLSLAYMPWLGKGSGTLALSLRWALPCAQKSREAEAAVQVSRDWGALKLYRVEVGAEDWSHRTLDGAVFDRVSFVGTDFTGDTLVGAVFRHCGFQGVSWDSVLCKKCVFEDIRQPMNIWNNDYAIGEYRVLSGFYFRRSIFEGASFSHSIFLADRSRFSQVLFEDSEVWLRDSSLVEEAKVRGGTWVAGGGIITRSSIRGARLDVDGLRHSLIEGSAYIALSDAQAVQIKEADSLRLSQSSDVSVQGKGDSLSYASLNGPLENIRMSGQRIRKLDLEDTLKDCTIQDLEVYDMDWTYWHPQGGIWKGVHIIDRLDYFFPPRYKLPPLEHFSLDAKAQTRHYDPDRNQMVQDSVAQRPWE